MSAHPAERERDDRRGAADAPTPAARPFAAPTRGDAWRAARAGLPAPFVAPADRTASTDSGAVRTAGGEGSADRIAAAAVVAVGGGAAGPVAAMRWPDAPEHGAARALDAIASRLRAGSLRLPVAADPEDATAVLVATLAGLHAERSAGRAGRERDA